MFVTLVSYCIKVSDMRVIKELILDVVGELSQEFAGQSLSADDICGFMEDSDPSVIKKALEELVIAKKPLLSKTEDGEYYYSGTKEDLKNLDNPDFYEIEEKAPKAQKPVEKEESLKQSREKRRTTAWIFQRTCSLDTVQKVSKAKLLHRMRLLLLNFMVTRRL